MRLKALHTFILVVSRQFIGHIRLCNIQQLYLLALRPCPSIYLFVLIIFGPLKYWAFPLFPFSLVLEGMVYKSSMSVCLWIPMLYLIDNFHVTHLGQASWLPP